MMVPGFDDDGAGEIQPLDDEQIAEILDSTSFTHIDPQGVRVDVALHKGFAGIPGVPWEMTLSIGFAANCCNALVLPASAARELAAVLVRAADMLDARES